MKTKILRYKLKLIGAFAGAVIGLTYWKFVGCASGTCAITSNPVNSTLYGAAMGWLVAGLFKKEDKKTTSTPKNTDHEKHGRTDQIG